MSFRTEEDSDLTDDFGDLIAVQMFSDRQAQQLTGLSLRNLATSPHCFAPVGL